MSSSSSSTAASLKSKTLPEGWSKGYSKSQKKIYYVHASTKHTQWHFPTAEDTARRGNKSKDNSTKRARSGGSSDDANKKQKTGVSVAIIVPYRDLHVAQKRAAHLKQFIPHMHRFFGKAQGGLRDYGIYIVEQSDDGRKFNRGKLLNIGFDVAKRAGHDVFIFHDVDLLPGQDLLESYTAFPTVPLHIARVWGRYSNNPKYFGGVVSFSGKDYERINGYPNTFWGWGGEDDEMQLRLEKCHIQWKWPEKGTLVDLEDMTLKEKLAFLRENKSWKCMVKWEALEEHEKTWKTNGLANLDYELLRKTNLDDTGKAVKLSVDVKLNKGHWAHDKAGVIYLP